MTMSVKGSAGGTTPFLHGSKTSEVDFSGAIGTFDGLLSSMLAVGGSIPLSGQQSMRGKTSGSAKIVDPVNIPSPGTHQSSRTHLHSSRGVDITSSRTTPGATIRSASDLAEPGSKETVTRSSARSRIPSTTALGTEKPAYKQVFDTDEQANRVASVRQSGKQSPVLEPRASAMAADHSRSVKSSMDLHVDKLKDKSKPGDFGLREWMGSVPGSILASASQSSSDIHPPSTAASQGTSRIDIRDANAVAQFSQLISVKADAGKSQLHVQVMPHGLGQLDVTVTKGPDGLQIQVVANQESTFSWLNQQLPALQQTLQETMQSTGVNVSGLQLSFGQHDGQSNSEDRQQKSPQPRKISGIQALDGVRVSQSDVSQSLAHTGDISLSI